MQQKLFSKILFAILLLPSGIFAQDIVGIWKGLIYADSIQGYKPYEVAVGKEKGRLIGYSHTTYNIDGKDEVWIRKLKVSEKGGKYILEDIGVVNNNLNLPQSKGVKKTSVLELSYADKEILLTGEWTTNRTKQFIAMHGTIQLLKENDIEKTAILQKLDSLKLKNNLSFNPNEIKTEPLVVKAEPPVVKPEVPKPVPVAKAEKKPDPVVVKEPVVIAPAAEVTARKTNTTQTVYYKSDSLVLTLYDNGEVDGDIVSVLMNGNILFAKQELSTRANSKTIYITKDTPDSVMLVMYAENLGSIPPNTGLMVILDGSERYELRFSADLKTNAAIILRRKKK